MKISVNLSNNDYGLTGEDLIAGEIYFTEKEEPIFVSYDNAKLRANYLGKGTHGEISKTAKYRKLRPNESITITQ